MIKEIKKVQIALLALVYSLSAIIFMNLSHKIFDFSRNHIYRGIFIRDCIDFHATSHFESFQT